MKKNRICIAVLWLASLLAVSFYGGAVSYGFFFGMCLVPVISGFYLLYVYVRFRVYQQIETRNITANAPVPYCFILKNEDFTVFTSVGVKLYSDFSTVDNVPDHNEYRLFPNDKLQFDTDLICRYRGEYEVGVAKIIIKDFFGLFRLEYQMPSTIQALVRPRIVKLAALQSIPELNVMLQSQQAYEKNETDILVRDYIVGDSLKKIHWKASARSGVLKVRNDIGTTKNRISIFVNLEKISADIRVYLPVENKILEAVIALLYYFTFQNTQIELIWGGESVNRRTLGELKQFQVIYEELAGIYFEKDIQFDALLQEAESSGRLSDSGALFLVTHRMEEELFARLSQWAMWGRIVVVYVITDQDISDYIRRRSIRMQIIAIDAEEELEGKL